MLQEEESTSEDVTKKAAKPLAPFYRTGGDGEQERKAWERAKMMADEDEDFDFTTLHLNVRRLYLVE